MGEVIQASQKLGLSAERNEVVGDGDKYNEGCSDQLKNIWLLLVDKEVH